MPRGLGTEVAKWMDSAVEAMKVQERVLHGQLVELRKHIREAEAARGAAPKRGRKRSRVEKIEMALQTMGKGTKDEIARHLREVGKAHSIDQTMRNNPELFEKVKDGRVNRWHLKGK